MASAPTLISTGWQVACTSCGREVFELVETGARKPPTPRQVTYGKRCPHCGSGRLHADMLWRRGG